MHTYKRNGKKWQVGYYELFASWTTETQGATDSRWRVVKELRKEDDAAAYASYLNGGSKP